MEYRVIGGTQYDYLQTQLNTLTGQGFRPILITSCTTPTGVSITVIMERAAPAGQGH
jgi:hypothetical protein